jgi:hypothetical protein
VHHLYRHSQVFHHHWYYVRTSCRNSTGRRSFSSPYCCRSPPRPAPGTYGPGQVTSPPEEGQVLLTNGNSGGSRPVVGKRSCTVEPSPNSTGVGAVDQFGFPLPDTPLSRPLCPIRQQYWPCCPIMEFEVLHVETQLEPFHSQEQD